MRRPQSTPQTAVVHSPTVSANCAPHPHCSSPASTLNTPYNQNTTNVFTRAQTLLLSQPQNTPFLLSAKTSPWYKRHRLLSLKLAYVKSNKTFDSSASLGRGHTTIYTVSDNDKCGHLPAAGMRCAPGTAESLCMPGEALLPGARGWFSEWLL